MRRSAESALIEAKRHIEFAEKAQSTEDTIKQYQYAKNILEKVDTTKEDALSLKDMMDAFLELANVLENKGPATQDRAEKCRQRAAALEQELDRANAIAATTTTTLSAIGSPLLFSKKADRETFVYHLPAPGEQLETTRQLAYCLSLLQESVDETRLDPDALKWRCSTLKSSDESIRINTIAHQVVVEFIKDSEKNATAVEEVVQLAQVLDKE
ncbi:hypothetical protein BGW38_004495, partial [Lunasporangiospora selenospora]